MTSAARVRVDVEHRLETQWQALIGIEPAPSSARPRVVIAGCDDVTLASFGAHLRASRPDVEVVTAASDPIRTSTRHGVSAVPLADPVAVDAVLDGAAALIVCADEQWRDGEFVARGGLAGVLAGAAPGRSPARWMGGPTSVLALALLGIVRGIPVHLHAISVSDLEDEGALRLVSYIAQACDSLTARDHVTAERLSRIKSFSVAAVRPTDGFGELIARLPTEGVAPKLAAGRLRMRQGEAT